MPQGRSFLASLLHLLSTVHDQDSVVHLDCHAISDLAMWNTFLSDWNGISLFVPRWDSASQIIFSDAAGSIGFAAIFRSHWLAARWPPEIQADPAAIGSPPLLELYPIVAAALVWGSSWSNLPVLFVTDNQSLVDIINSGNARSGSFRHSGSSIQLIHPGLASLVVQAERLVEGSLSHNTARNYRAGFTAFSKFAREFPRGQLEETSYVMAFIAFFHTRLSLLHSTIKLYLAGLQHHRLIAKPDGGSILASQAVKATLRGLQKKRKGPRTRRLPVSGELFRALSSALDGSPFGPSLSTVLKTAIYLGFYGFLRPGEFTSGSGHHSFLQKRHLVWSADHFVLHLPSSKSNQSGPPTEIKFFPSGNYWCPVEVLWQLSSCFTVSPPDSPLLPCMLTFLCSNPNFPSIGVINPFASEKESPHKLLLISFDGFRWDYDQDVDTPNMDILNNDGVKAKYMTPAFITITSPCHFTLLTGRYIENHGVIHNMYFNVTNLKKENYLSTQGISAWWDNGTLPIWITAQRQGLKTGSLFFPGGNATYGGETVNFKKVESRLHNYSNETEWKQNVETVMTWFTEEDLDFVALYFGEPDSVGHKYGPESQERKDMVRQVDRMVGHIRNRVKHHDLESKLNIIIIADHGMTKVEKGSDEIVLRNIPDFSFNDLQFHLVDYGPAGLLLPKEGKLEKVYQALKGAHPKLNVYKKEDVPKRLHFSNNARITPLVLYGEPGYVIHSYMKFQFNNGEHGFDNDVMDMKTIFRAVGPSFKKGLIVEPFESVNVYALMCELLGITPEPHDGDLEVTKNMLLMDNQKDTGSETDVFFHATIGLTVVIGILFIAFVITVIVMAIKRRRKTTA
ncbi:ectonucleotide pyrophosphatase/phosphodiesterase family member 7 [Bufo gargarizans]|uniref:ectonucleotide pyrophosphatase/phosphodiesterase family member 7 n=1 Tax=Bufo gargarizans TaxID=30331 RepID=UPI001CF1BA3C|nr:ectonucleotide pyrophosphatase/phosphodiesterase family member 7 [Bufo gargarizans]